jgi:hypothetical protein
MSLTKFVELNIRLDVRHIQSTSEEIRRRERLALALLGSCLHHRSDFLEQGALVPRLVVAIEVSNLDRARLHQLAEELHQLAEELHQDCIAVLFDCDTGFGELVGPRSEVYGPFDLAKFERLDRKRAFSEGPGQLGQVA